MKKFLSALLILLLFIVFAAYAIVRNRTKEVLKVKTPVLLGIDINGNKTLEPDENICVSGIESFSLGVDSDFKTKYSKKFKLSAYDIVAMGFLADDFAQKEIQNKNVVVKYTKTITKDCVFADVYVNGTNYADILKNSGFGIANSEIGNKKKFFQMLSVARKLNLVLLNHHSNKYHTLDCKYGKLARDIVIIPLKYLPKSAKPCKFCHNINNKKFKKKKFGRSNSGIPFILPPPTVVTQGNLALFITNFTRNLTPRRDCTASVCTEFVKLVNNSQESIDMALYGYDNIPAITQALKNAKSRGVKIRYIFDEAYDNSQNYYKDNNIIVSLADSSISDRTQYKVSSNYLMHNKFVVFDNKVVYTGSMNFSSTGLSEYDQNDVMVINSKEVAKLFELEFEQMINGLFHKKKKIHNVSNVFKIGNTILEVYFSPQYHSSDRIIQLIANSRKYIYLPTFLVTHAKIAQELIAARKRGVDVKIIMDANNVHIRNSKHQLLKGAGIPVKIENFAGKMHSKTIIIDDKYLIMGSMNFSNSGENKNDENLLIITNSDFATGYRNYFNYLWKVIPDKYLRFYPKAESLDSIGSCFDGIDNNFNGKIDKDEEFCHINKNKIPSK